MTRAIRAGAWAIILVLAAFQAYAHRYAVSPDGVSYLDLSDAVVTGRWGELLNLYWSPLYPFLVGVARVIGGAAPGREIPLMHLVNFVSFVAMFAAFEYFLVSVWSLARRSRRPILRGPWGAIAVYSLFGMMALTMTPLELTTPDWLSNAAVFVALGALLRLRESPHDRGAAFALGAALGVGALAKSFMIPWAVVCFATLALFVGRNARGVLTRAIVAWAVFVIPWVAALSHRAGHITFGEAGRLTWAWFVNEQDVPSLGGMPGTARTARTDDILPGTGVTGDAPGTNPVWYDPVRWNRTIRPRLVLSQEAATLRVMSITILSSLSVLLFVSLPIAVAEHGSRRVFLRRAAVVLIPCLAGIVGYAMVLVTSRYIMAFTLGAVLVTLAGLPLARRMHPVWLLVGTTIPILLLALSPVSAAGFSFVAALVAAMIVGGTVSLKRPVTWVPSVVLALAISLFLFSPRTPSLLPLAAGLFAITLWWLASRAVRRGRPVAFARGTQAALVFGVSLVFGGRLALRVVRDANAFRNAAALANPQWRIAEDLAAHDVAPGTRIALIGPVYESYWARTARLKIVASVPDPLVTRWWALPPSSRDGLLAQFAASGARVAIVTRPPRDGAPDSSWTRLAYGGWMRKLK